MSTSQVYAVLKRLVKEGLILGKSVQVREAPTRMEYTITAKGEKKLQEWLYEANPSPSIHWIRVIFFSKIYIANLLGIPIDEIIDHQQKVCFITTEGFFPGEKTSSIGF